jgi:hypothetical protein
MLNRPDRSRFPPKADATTDSFDRPVVKQLDVTDGRRKRRIDDEVIADRRIDAFGRGRENRPDGPERKRR